MTPSPYWHTDGITLHAGDCLDILTDMPDNSVDAIVTDPPYSLSFMSAKWDTHDTPHAFQQWCQQWATQAHRVMKPGAHLLAFGGTRTFHRLACAIEDAGFEIRDSIGYGHTERPGLLAWMTGSGFPKSSRVNKDARFCRCVSSGHTSSHTSLGQRPDGHTRTEDDAGPAERGGRSARRETRTAQGSPVDCRPGCDCGDEPPHLGLMADLVGLPSRECARGRSRSVVPEGGLADGSSHSPSQALHIGRPSSRDFGVLADSETGESENTRRSTSPADTFGSVHRKLDSSQGPSPVEYSNAFPVCTSCGKPNADGLGTSLKPAWEPIVCARKPLVGTLAQNVLTYGTGALNIDAARIAHRSNADRAESEGKNQHTAYANPGSNRDSYSGSGNMPARQDYDGSAGRWPANVVLDGGYPGSAADTLDEQTGISCSSVRKPSGKDERGIPNTASSVVVRRNDTQPRGVADSGGASRFFKVVHASPADSRPDPFAAPFVPWRYEAKAPTSERPRVPGEGAGNGRVTGLGGKVRQCNVCQTRAIESGAGEPSCGHGDYRWEAPTTEAVNTVAHPTVKPLDLIRWLVRLITPPGGTVLDMFAGSGTTGEACVVEGFPVILVERDVTYLPLIVARLSKPIQPDLFGGLDTPPPAPPPAGRAQASGGGAGEAVPGQLGLFNGA
jgi:hypothetical protein